MGCLSGEWYDTELDVFVLKDPGYNITLMKNFSGLTVIEVQEEERSMMNGGLVKFKYTEVVSNH